MSDGEPLGFNVVGDTLGLMEGLELGGSVGDKLGFEVDSVGLSDGAYNEINAKK